ncbi:heparinase II/III family protein, partial [Kluyvera ascorbata ATCC 33433]
MRQFSGLWPEIAARAVGEQGLIEQLVKDAQPMLDAAVCIP